MDSSIFNAAAAALEELLECARLRAGQLVVIGCSSSEIVGQHIGKGSSPAAAQAVYAAVAPILAEHGLSLAAQCCEHLNRALVMERADAERFGYAPVCVRPVPKAGGSFASAVYDGMTDPVVVEHVRADAGLDIGLTLIGMHLKEVAVPVRLQTCRIGEAVVTAARTRPKLIGGCRAVYPEEVR